MDPTLRRNPFAPIPHHHHHTYLHQTPCLLGGRESVDGNLIGNRFLLAAHHPFSPPSGVDIPVLQALVGLACFLGFAYRHRISSHLGGGVDLHSFRTRAHNRESLGRFLCPGNPLGMDPRGGGSLCIYRFCYRPKHPQGAIIVHFPAKKYFLFAYFAKK